YRARPSRTYLTSYYVIMSVGGALGGLFNSILAPVLFNDVYEGPITLVLSALLLTRTHPRRGEFVWPLLATVCCAAPLAVALWLGVENMRPFAVLTCLLFFVCLWPLRGRPLSMAIVTALLMFLGQFMLTSPAILKERSFFGTYSVRVKDGLRILNHGTTQHGAERLADIGKRPMPTSYYFPNAPMGRIMGDIAWRGDETVGVVGLGVGALACYRQPGQFWHFYEIDEVVDQIARNPGLFDFMSHCAGNSPTHIGDARMVLERQDIKFDILVIDSYSSDAIPVHLMTTEAVRIYLAHLKPDGLLVFHISNRFFALGPVLARIARDLGLSARSQVFIPSNDDAKQGAVGSEVVVATQEASPLGRMMSGAGGEWVPLAADDKP
ncbi:MAG: transporter, partial [Rhodobacteraceae bacterium]|nr:transporter [Paracoccaceae bacterium]